MTDWQDQNSPRPPQASGQPPDFEREDEIDLAQLWGILWSGKWKIAAFIAAALLVAVFYLFVTQPSYRADALLQIQSKGSSPLQGVTSDLKKLTGKGGSPAQSEIPIIKSRTVLGETVDKLNLATDAGPRYFPVIGWAVASRREAAKPAAQAVSVESGSWLSNYAWQPTRVALDRMTVPDQLTGKPFTLRALGGEQFVLYDPDGKQILQGRVGEAAEGETPQGQRVELFVARLDVGAPPTDFTLVHSRWLPVVEGLNKRLSVAEAGEETGVINIALEGNDRQRITRIVNSVAERYLRQNVEARSKQAEKSLTFLNKKLPELQKELQASEAKLAEYRQKEQAIDLDQEGKALLDQVVAIEDKRSKLQLKLAELKQTYTGKHPAIESVREQMQSLRQERQQLKSKVGDLPETQKKILRRRRSVEVNTKLYTGLLNRAQELRMLKAGAVGNVRIIDEAVAPVEAVSPKSMLVLALSLVLGGFLGCGFVFLQAALRRGVNDPKEIENQLGLSVYAVIPYSSWLARHAQRAERRGEPEPVLARDRSDETPVEAMRSLRTSLYFAQMDAGSNAILVTGPSPGVGKSFISSNLAYLLSEVGQSVVVVDADMRKGRLHSFVENRKREPGLSQVLTGQLALSEALQTMHGSNVKVLTTGQVPPNPSELLMREEFARVIEQLKSQFDLVLIDAPPIMAVTDAAIIAASVPGIVSFMVARSGAHPMAEIEEAVNRMTRHDRRIAGVVFNAYRQEHASQSGGYSYYQYEYKKQT